MWKMHACECLKNWTEFKENARKCEKIAVTLKRPTLTFHTVDAINMLLCAATASGKSLVALKT